MATRVQCICGSPIECEQLELVVTLPCSACKRELRMRYAGQRRTAKRMVIRQLDAGNRTSERIVLPIGVEMTIGSKPGQFMTVANAEVAPQHCSIRVDSHGHVKVTDLKSPHGTWIGDARIIEGVLEPGQDLRIGLVRLRVESEDANMPPADSDDELDRIELEDPAELPVMETVEGDETPIEWLISNRFPVVRWTLIVYVWLGVLHHLATWRTWLGDPPTGLWFLRAPVVIVAAVVATIIIRRAASTEPRWNIAVIALISVIAVTEAFMTLWFAAAAALILAVFTGIHMIRTPKPGAAVVFTAAAGMSVVTLFFVTVSRLQTEIPLLIELIKKPLAD